MTPQFPQSERCISTSDTSSTLAPEDQPNTLTQSEIEESRKYPPLLAFHMSLDEGSRMMVDCLSLYILGARTFKPYVFVIGLTAACRNTVLTDWEPIVVVLVDSLQSLLCGGPPPLPQDIGHLQTIRSFMPWIFNEVTPGRPIINLPFSQTATANDTDSRRSSVGLLLSILSFRTSTNHPPEEARPYLEERLAATQPDTKKRLLAAGDNDAMCQTIWAKEAEQKVHYIAPWRTALVNHNRKLSNPHADIEDWMLIEVADGISVTNKIGHNRDHLRARESALVSWQQLSSFDLRGDSDNIAVNKDLEPIGLAIKALVLPTDDKLTFLCNIKEVFNHTEEVLQLPQGAVKIFVPPSRKR
ncbi:hypothetical protein F5146DRAFT_998728 [Armillaria mellea]|nr:hypothetical protein F5146DRAFT_998728 [Armillaria mellea]